MGWIIGKGIGVPFRLGGSGLGSTYWTPQTAVVENAAPTDIVLTYAKAVNPADAIAGNFTIAGKTISGAVLDGTGKILTLTVTVAFVYGDSVVLVANSTEIVVTNNVTPPSILLDGNTVFWFDNDPDTITRDGSNLVSKWADKLAGGNDLLQADGAKQPLYSPLYITFNGTDEFLKCAAFTWNQPVEIYLVVRQPAWASSDYLFDGNTNASVVIYQGGTTAPRLRAWAGADSEANANLALKTVGILRYLANGASSKFQIDETAAWTGNLGANNADGFTLGGKSDGTANMANVQVIAVIGRKIADTVPNDTIIYNFLKAKYYLNGDAAFIGDSTVTAYSSYTKIWSRFGVNGTKYELATVGETINKQLARWDALTEEQKSGVVYVYCEIGLNDLNPSEAASIAIGRYQTLVTTIKADSPNSKLILATMTPCKARLIAVYGAVDGLVAYQKWLDMNEAIKGEGENAITGADAVLYGHTTAMDDGSGNLAATYDGGDGIHPNEAGRDIIAISWLTEK